LALLTPLAGENLDLGRTAAALKHTASGGKTALVLSAGGMYGAYQAGVWKTLSERFQPDLIVGASVGSLNGWLIAGGVSGGDLVHRWLSLDLASELRWRLPRSLSDGFLDGELLEQWAREMCRDYSPRIEYGLVATEVPSLRPKLFRGAEITWRHLAASCAVPLVLRHHRIDGVYYTDGGLVDPCPLWAAVEMGADRIVAVNVLKTRPLAIQAMAAAARARGLCRPSHFPGVEIIDISPSGSLGSPRDAMYWTRANAERWVELGMTNASEKMRAPRNIWL